MKELKINERLKAAFEKKNVCILAHRGTVGANIVDNTTEAFDVAIRHGADMVEIDVCASLDGELFVLHDGTEMRMVGTDRNLTTMTSEEIRSLRYINKNSIVIDHPVQTFQEVLEHLKGRCLINLDRCWVCWDKVLPVVRAFGMEDQILLKSPPEAQYLRLLAEQDTPFMYMPVIWYPEEMERALSCGLNIVAAEFIGYAEDASIMQEAYVRSLRDKGLACLISTLTLGNPVYDMEAACARLEAAGSRLGTALRNGKGNIFLAAGHDDDTSVLGDPDAGWGWLVERGFNFLQTDWVLDMALYLKRKGYNR